MLYLYKKSLKRYCGGIPIFFFSDFLILPTNNFLEEVVVRIRMTGKENRHTRFGHFVVSQYWWVRENRVPELNPGNSHRREREMNGGVWA